jgi:hypothetical protein
MDIDVYKLKSQFNIDNSPEERDRITYKYINPIPVGNTGISKHLDGHELYVYFRGELIFKKWYNSTQEHVFHDSEGLTQYTVEYKRRSKYQR